MSLAALVSGARHVTVEGVPGFPRVYRAHTIMTPSKGTRGPGAVDLDKAPPGWPPEYNVKVIAVGEDVEKKIEHAVARFERGLVFLVVLAAMILGACVWIGVEIDTLRTIESNRSGYEQATIDVLCEIRDGKRYTKEK